MTVFFFIDLYIFYRLHISHSTHSHLPRTFFFFFLVRLFARMGDGKQIFPVVKKMKLETMHVL